jgi:LemA protein
MITIILVLTLGLLAAVLFIIGGWVWGTYNLFINNRQNIKTQWSNVLAEYQRRADLLYNLAQAVKSYAKFEHDTMTHVIQARGGNFGKTKPEQIKTLGKMDDSFSNFMSRLLVVFEKYPKLKAIEQYNEFTKETRISEDRINVARTDYNGVVKEYNNSILTFPNKILAKMWRYFEEKFYLPEKSVFQLEEDARVDLSLTLEGGEK